MCCNNWNSSFSDITRDIWTNWTSFDMIRALKFLLDDMYAHFGEAVYNQTVGIPIEINCALSHSWRVSLLLQPHSTGSFF